MKRVRPLAVFIAIIALAGMSWFGLKQYRCNQRNAAFGQLAESTKQMASEKLKTGTKNADVARFFMEHSIPFTIVESTAYGTIYATGCAPMGCGTDAAMIGIRVKLDDVGSVSEAPVVVGIYTNCL